MFCNISRLIKIIFQFSHAISPCIIIYNLTCSRCTSDKLNHIYHLPLPISRQHNRHVIVAAIYNT